MTKAIKVGLQALAISTLVLILLVVNQVCVHAQTTDEEQANPANQEKGAAVNAGMSKEALLSQIITLCPTPDREQSDECKEALNTYFLPELIETSFDLAQNDAWLDFGEPLTFADVFSGIQNDVALVLEALTKEECRLNERNQVDVDLSEDCHAEAFRNVYFLQVNCGFSSREFNGIRRSISLSPRPERGSRNRGTPSDNQAQPSSPFVAFVDNQIRTSQRARESELSQGEIDSIKHQWWDRYLKPRWVLNQCEALDFKEINDYPSKQGPDVFASIAARLGDRYAMVAYKNFDTPSGFSRWLESNHRWLSEYRELTREYPIVEPANTENLFNFTLDTYQKRLVSYFNAMKAMKELGWGYDLEKMVSKFCTTPFLVQRENEENSVIAWSGDCSWLTFGLHSSFNDPQLLTILEEFEQKAKERNVFYSHSLNSDLAKRALSNPDLSVDQGLQKILSQGPVYPQEAHRDGVEGWVIVKYDVMHDGTVVNVQVEESEPNRTFDQAALDAVSMFRYLPLVKENKPHNEKGVKLRLVFSLGS